MDCLKRTYKSNMRLYRDRPDVLTPGRWYWCVEGAKAIPYHHIFGSFTLDVSTEIVDPPVGEVPMKTGKFNGAASPRYLGQNWCGGQDLWTQGALYSQRGTPAVDAEGVPTCCISGPPDPGGVVVFGGLDCLLCPSGNFVQYDLTIAGIAGSPGCVALNGVYRVTYIGNCTWESADVPPLFIPPSFRRWYLMQRGIQQLVEFRPSFGATFFRFNKFGAWDCQSQITLGPFGSLTCNITVASVVVNPVIV